MSVAYAGTLELTASQLHALNASTVDENGILWTPLSRVINGYFALQAETQSALRSTSHEVSAAFHTIQNQITKTTARARGLANRVFHKEANASQVNQNEVAPGLIPRYGNRSNYSQLSFMPAAAPTANANARIFRPEMTQSRAGRRYEHLKTLFLEFAPHIIIGFAFGGLSGAAAGATSALLARTVTSRMPLPVPSQPATRPGILAQKYMPLTKLMALTEQQERLIDPIMPEPIEPRPNAAKYRAQLRYRAPQLIAA